MRKYISILLVVFFISGILNGCELKSYNIEDGSLELEELDYDEIKDKLIRFHVIANSDTEEDQALKLKVRDRVIDELSYKLNEAESVEEAKEILETNIDFVNEIAKEVISENNYNYEVNTMLSYENFPDKVYGDYIFPQGTYEAFRIIIGTGEGQNWWCVMFPPLCFIDVTKGKVEEDKSKEVLDSQILSNKEAEEEEEEDKPVIKFKILEFFKSIFG